MTLLRRLLLAAAALAVAASPAQARHAHRHGHHAGHHARQHAPAHARRVPVACRILTGGGQYVIPEPCLRRLDRLRERNRWVLARAAAAAAAGFGPRPHAWCGWYARQLVGRDPGPAYNLARNWAHWGRAASPGVGVMVVWPHHVGMITGQAPDGRWIVKSGNDAGGMVRERPRSIAGAIALRKG